MKLRLNGVEIEKDEISKYFESETLIEKNSESKEKESFLQILKFPRVLSRLIAVCIIK